MPVICLGPLCIPLWPVLAIALKPIWDKVLPESVKAKLIMFWARLVALVCPARKNKEKKNTTPSESSTDLITHIHEKATFESLKSSSIPLIVKFTATWCNPCKQIQPKVAEIANEQSGKIMFAEVDIEEMDELASDAGVASIPAFHAYVNGELIHSFVGANTQKLNDLVIMARAKAAKKSSSNQ
jgi:thioredoxin 1